MQCIQMVKNGINWWNFAKIFSEAVHLPLIYHVLKYFSKLPALTLMVTVVPVSVSAQVVHERWSSNSLTAYGLTQTKNSLTGFS